MSYDATRRCPILAHYRYTWPGRDESWVCLIHGIGLQNIARAIQMPLQLVPLGPEEIGEHTCQQFLSAKEQESLDGTEDQGAP